MSKTIFVQFVLIDVCGVSRFFEYFCSFFVFVKGQHKVLYVNSGCFRCISGINLSPANKTLLFVVFIVFIFSEKIHNHDFWISNHLNSLFFSCSSINLDFLLSDAVQFDRSIAFTLVVSATLGLLLFVFFLRLKQHYSTECQFWILLNPPITDH